MRKKRTREHIIADLSVNHVERQFLLAGHTAQRVIFDYGYDLFVQTFDANGELEKGYLLIQVKATEAARRVAGSEMVAVTIDRRDVESWLQDVSPVALILYDAASETAYFLLIEQGIFSSKVAQGAGATITLRIPASNLLNYVSVKTLHDYKNALFTKESNDTNL